jgi:zona occludens toxin
MAVTFYTGIPRSGKSVKAVSHLYHTFVNPPSYYRFSFINYGLPRENELLLSSKNFFFFKLLKLQKKNLYTFAYTNLNQFKFEISPLIKKLDFDSLFDNLTILHAHYMDKKDDEFLIGIAKSMDLFQCLFVIDEAQNYFKGKDNVVLVWWFTYHAHFSHDIILITQDLKLVNDEYKRVAEYFYRAVPQRLRLSKSVIKYRSYSSYNMYQKDYISTESLKVNPLYFTLFVSGSHTVSRSIFYKYLLLFFIFLIIAIYFGFNFYTDLTTKSVAESNTTTNTQLINNEASNKQNVIYPVSKNNSTQQKKEEIKAEIIEDIQLFKFDCYSTVCNYKNSFEFPKQFLDNIIKSLDKSLVHIKLNSRHAQYHILIDTNKLNFLPKDKKNEKSDNSILPTR